MNQEDYTNIDTRIRLTLTIQVLRCIRTGNKSDALDIHKAIAILSKQERKYQDLITVEPSLLEEIEHTPEQEKAADKAISNHLKGLTKPPLAEIKGKKDLEK